LHLVGLVLLAALTAGVGCADDTPEPAADDPQLRPLRPLVYTEDPEQTARAVAARERRLMRQLLEGSNTDGSSWGSLESNAGGGLPELDSAEHLGRLAFRALVDREDRAWDYIFVTPRDYAALVNLDLEKARRFVDNQQADARSARRYFEIDKPSEAPRGGLTSVFTFESLELGKGRTLGGSVADDDEVVAQHWNNILKLGLADGETTFELRIRKILRIHLPGGPDDEQTKTRLGIASEISIGRRLRVFLEAGMHLKPELLRSSVYPFPLEVGNYWRYRRRPADRPEKADTEADPTGQPGGPDRKPAGLKASEVTQRVTSVDRYNTRRLVSLQFAYNDANLTQRREHWLVTPRRIFRCPRPCRRHIEDLDWLLSYLGRQTALFEFPLERGSAWGEPVYPSRQQEAFRVDAKWRSIEVPAGSFYGTLVLRGIGPLGDRVPFHRVQRLTRMFAPGKGVVRRRYRRSWSDEADTIVESLVDYRLMSR
jgi:hypothetical protein